MSPAGPHSSRLGLSWASPYDPEVDRARAEDRARGRTRADKNTRELHHLDGQGKDEAPPAEEVGDGRQPPDPK